MGKIRSFYLFFDKWSDNFSKIIQPLIYKIYKRIIPQVLTFNRKKLTWLFIYSLFSLSFVMLFFKVFILGSKIQIKCICAQ